MIRTIVASLLAGFVVTANAGLNEGVAAFESAKQIQEQINNATLLRKKSYLLALKELVPLAEQGNAEAQYYVGLMYANGQGVESSYANTTQAVSWYRKAAEQGNVDAQNQLGKMLANGYGVRLDRNQGAYWRHKAAKQGNISTQPWNAKATYAVGSKVTYAGNTYRAIQAHACISFDGNCDKAFRASEDDFGSNLTPNKTPILWVNLKQFKQDDMVSPITNAEVINGIALPLDPGAAGKQTLAGIDSDKDGVRDDIQRFLAKELGHDSVKYKRALQIAREMQQSLFVVATHDREKARLVANRWGIAKDCFREINEVSEEDYMKDVTFFKAFEVFIANTPERMDVYMQYNGMLGGMVFGGKQELVCE